MAVALGLDWVVIDAEHGHLDWKDIVEHSAPRCAATRSPSCASPSSSVGLVKRALDIGADGVVIPWVESAEQLREAVAFAHYPPEGVRGIGAERATCWGQCFVEQRDRGQRARARRADHRDRSRGGRNIDAICSASTASSSFCFGPADYSSSAGFRGQWEGPGVAEEIAAASRTRSAPPASTAASSRRATRTSTSAAGRASRMLGVGLDAGLLLRSLHDTLASVGRDRKINPAFSPESRAAARDADGPPAGDLPPGPAGGDERRRQRARRSRSTAASCSSVSSARTTARRT